MTNAVVATLSPAHTSYKDSLNAFRTLVRCKEAPSTVPDEAKLKEYSTRGEAGGQLTAAQCRIRTSSLRQAVAGVGATARGRSRWITVLNDASGRAQ